MSYSWISTTEQKNALATNFVLAYEQRRISSLLWEEKRSGLLFFSKSLQKTAIPDAFAFPRCQSTHKASIARLSSAFGVVVQCNADSTAMMAVVLPDDLLRAQLPQSRVVVAASCDEVRAIGTESAVPDPALVAIELLLELEAAAVLVAAGGRGAMARQVHRPDTRRVVCGASGEVADVWRQEDAGDVGLMRLEFGHRDERRDVFVCDDAPDVDGALLAIAHGGAEERAVRGHRHRGHGLVFFRDQLVRTLVLRQVPDPHVAASVAADEFALVGVDDYVVYGDAVAVVALDVAASRVPDLDGAVFGTRHHPFAFAVEG